MTNTSDGGNTALSNSSEDENRENITLNMCCKYKHVNNK